MVDLTRHTNFVSHRVRIKAMIDAAVGKARTAFFTNVPGQDYIYVMKYDEATRCMADPAPQAANYPYLSAYGPNLKAQAQAVITAKQTMDAKLAGLEQLRLQYKAAVDTFPNDVDAIKATVATYLQNIANFK